MASVQKKSAVPRKETSTKKRILIVEDERPLAHALELKLANSGYDVTVASTGADGLKQAKTQKFNLILLDLILPGMDGFSVLDALHKAKNNVPVVILSNLGQEEDKEKTKKYGVTDYCVKANTPLSSIIQIVKTKIK